MRYDNQIVIQLERDRAIYNICEGLTRKHSHETWWGVLEQEGTGWKLAPMGGLGPLTCGDNTRVYISGHGNGLVPPSISGFTPSALATAIAPFFSERKVRKIGIISCYSGGLPAVLLTNSTYASADFAKDFHVFMGKIHKIRTEVTGYEAMITMSSNGHKLKGLNPTQMQTGLRQLKKTYSWQNGAQECRRDEPLPDDDAAELTFSPGEPMDVD